MLEKIISKLHEQLSFQGNSPRKKNEIPEKTRFVANIPHPNKKFGIIRLEASGFGNDLLSFSVKNVKNLKPGKAEPLMQVQKSAVADIDKTQKTDLANDPGDFIGRGSRGSVYRNGDFVTKIIQIDTSNTVDFILKNKELQHETSMCNAYWMKENSSSPATMRGNQITMPFIAGTLPSLPETSEAVRDLFSKGLMMGDAAPENFIRTESGKIVPVDFGLVFNKDSIKELDKQTKIEIVHDYIKGGHRCVPTELKAEYAVRLKDLDSSLGASSPARSMNVRELSKAGLLKRV